MKGAVMSVLNDFIFLCIQKCMRLIVFETSLAGNVFYLKFCLKKYFI